MERKSSHTGPLSPEYALLGLLELGPSYGYELYQSLISDLGQVWHTSLSQAYNILNRLENQGYIAARVFQQDKHPDRRLFSLTPAGQERFESWMQDTSFTSVRAIRLEFLTRIYFARKRGREFTHQVIETQLGEVRTGLERIRKQKDQVPEGQLINRLSLELRVSQLESIEVWLEGCHQAIEKQPITFLPKVDKR